MFTPLLINPITNMDMSWLRTGIIDRLIRISGSIVNSKGRVSSDGNGSGMVDTVMVGAWLEED